MAAVLIAAAFLFAVVIFKNINTGSRHDEKGMTAFNEADYDTSVKEFKEALSYDPNNAQYYTHLGMAYIGLKSYDEALGYFKQAISHAENDVQKALACRGQGLAHLYSGDYEDSIESFQSALSYKDSGLESDIQKDILSYQAQACESAGDYKSAADCYSQALEISGSDTQILTKRGLAYEQLGDYASAEKDLQTAVSGSKKSYYAYQALYNALAKQGKTDQAGQVLDQALDLGGSSGKDLYFQGMIYLEKNDLADAQKMFESSYKKGCKYALIGQAQSAVRGKDYEKASSSLEKYISEAGSGSKNKAFRAKAYDLYALCLIKQKKYDEAIKACQSGLDLNDRDTDASLTFNLIAAYEQKGEWEKAYSAAKTCHEKYPDDKEGTREFEFLESRMSK